jgi:hypothetical protein
MVPVMPWQRCALDGMPSAASSLARLGNSSSGREFSGGLKVPHCPLDAEEVDDDQGLPVLLTGTNLRDRSPVLMVALRRSTRASAGWTVT